MSEQDQQPELERLRKRVEQLTRINASLMDRVERTVDGSGSAYALFEANVVMQQTIRERTAELARLNESLRQEVEERKAAEALMREARDQANAANQAKSQFLANMSHEIRTPLTAMIGYAEIIRDHPAEADAVRDHAGTVCRNGVHLLTLINDILDLSKLEAGEMQLFNEPVSPMGVVNDVCRLLKVRAEGKGIALEVRPSWPLPAHASCDPTRLKQVLTNLIGNAIKFTEVGSVRVVVEYLEHDGASPRLVFKIVDTGIGMTEETIGRIFRPFKQADESMARRFGGTGLGLAICTRLTEIMGGRIGVASVPHEGSTFTVDIPVGLDDIKLISDQPDAAASSGRGPVRGPTLENARILLVEDGPDNQRLIRFHLKKAGAEVEIAENGLVALDAIERKGPFDLVLMDMQMPEMDGYAATAELRARGCGLPILALTAHAMKGDRERCIDAGCDDFLTKPIDAPRLISTIRGYLDGYCRLSA